MVGSSPSVRELCTSLGYGEERRDARRCWRKLTFPLKKFCRDFKGDDGLDNGELSLETLGIRLRAIEFIELHPEFFKEMNSGYGQSEYGWPSLPTNKDEIISILSSLIYAQAANYRYNKSAYKKSTNKKRSRCLEADDTLNKSESDNELKDPLWKPSSISWRLNPTTVEVKIDQGQQRIESDPKYHVDWISSELDPSITVQCHEWLFRSGCLPKNIEQFVNRYIHKHGLYNEKRANLNKIQRLSRKLKHVMAPKCNKNQNEIIYEKCTNLVSSICSEWKRDGLLVDDHNGALKPIAEFETLLNASNTRPNERPSQDVRNSRTSSLQDVNVQLRKDSRPMNQRVEANANDLTPINLSERHKRQRLSSRTSTLDGPSLFQNSVTVDFTGDDKGYTSVLTTAASHDSHFISAAVGLPPSSTVPTLVDCSQISIKPSESSMSSRTLEYGPHHEPHRSMFHQENPPLAFCISPAIKPTTVWNPSDFISCQNNILASNPCILDEGNPFFDTPSSDVPCRQPPPPNNVAPCTHARPETPSILRADWNMPVPDWSLPDLF
ncbi:hypothetical protein B7494_g6194 [Chlorociboria aeruginascens]|nr:hypothetical protein B7494_g6194 [Chlorociboria aeruginascens]